MGYIILYKCNKEARGIRTTGNYSDLCIAGLSHLLGLVPFGSWLQRFGECGAWSSEVRSVAVSRKGVKRQSWDQYETLLLLFATYLVFI